jgi:hypothetical protein
MQSLRINYLKIFIIGPILVEKRKGRKINILIWEQ